MAKHDAKWTPDTEDALSTHPKTRDRLVQENRDRRETEPAAAPQEADSETGTPGPVPASPSMEPRNEQVRAEPKDATKTGQHDVRVGPGDAGAADTPTESTERVPDRKDTWSRAMGIIAVAALIAVVVALLF